MSWKTSHFRDPIHRELAQRARNEGHGKAHASWGAIAKARRQANEEAGPAGDNFDQWLVEVKDRVSSIMNEARLTFIRAQEELSYGDEIPF